MSFTPSAPTHPMPLPIPSSPLSAPPVWRVAPRRPASPAPTTPAGEPPALRVPAPAGWETGGTPHPGTSTVAGATSEAPHSYHRRLAGASLASTLAGATGDPAWLVPETLLAEIEPEARPWLRRIFEQTLEAVKAEQALPPERRRLTPQPYLVQHLGRPRFQAQEPRQHDQPDLHRLLRQTIWRAVDALEAGLLLAAGDVYQPLLAEQCAQLGRVYREIKRRAGAWVALVLLQGELRFLHHRGAAAVERLLFA